MSHSTGWQLVISFRLQQNRTNSCMDIDATDAGFLTFQSNRLKQLFIKNAITSPEDINYTKRLETITY